MERKEIRKKCKFFKNCQILPDGYLHVKRSEFMNIPFEDRKKINVVMELDATLIISNNN